MLMINSGGESFNHTLVNFIYRLIFNGLQKINFENISYFALVFSAQMIILEYFQEYQRLELMLIFFLFKFLPFYVIEALDLSFDSLFEVFSATSQSAYQGRPPVQAPNSYRLSAGLDLVRVLTRVNWKVTDLINQITFCRSECAQELINLMVTENIDQPNCPNKEELRQRYFKIEMIRNVNTLHSLIKVALNRGSRAQMTFYNDLNVLKQYYFGRSERL